MTELIRVTRGVRRAPTDGDLDLSVRCAALLSVLPTDAVVAGRTAARLHGLWLPGDGSDERPEFIVQGTTDIPRNHSRSGRPEVRIRRRRLTRGEVVQVAGLPLTGLATTWLHLSECLRLEDLVAAGDSVLRSGTSRDELMELVRRSGRQRGVRSARSALPLLDGRSRSRPESWMRVGLVLHDLRPSGVNADVHDEFGQWLGQPDLSYDAARLAVEYNGRHHADLDQTRRDITRGVDLAERGRWYTLVLGPRQVFQRMDHTALLVRELCRERAPMFG